jgi:hypothetical protein
MIYSEGGERMIHEKRETIVLEPEEKKKGRIAVHFVAKNIPNGHKGKKSWSFYVESVKHDSIQLALRSFDKCKKTIKEEGL